MGRPINKRFFGPLSGTTGSASGDGYAGSGQNVSNTGTYSEKQRGFNIPVEQARIAGGELDIGGDGAATPYIISQKGSRKYRVMTSSGAGNCILVDDDGSSNVSNGEMLIKGYLNGIGQPGIAIKKLTKYYAIDFNNNRYKWYVDNNAGDSSLANVLILTVATDTSVN